MEDYPLENCEKHPDRLWEWDGYCYICIDCILDRPASPRDVRQDSWAAALNGRTEGTYYKDVQI